MSYLLDALNKSRGDNNHQADTPQPVMYQQTGFTNDEGVNVYKWISIILALILTLLVGIVLGNRYSLSITPNSPVTTPAPVQLTQPLSQTPTEQKPTVSENVVSSNPVVIEQPQSEIKSQPENVGQVVQKTNEQTQPETAVPYNEEPIVVSGEPKKLKSVKALKDTGLTNISNELLQKFNQAIQDSEGVDEDYNELQSQQTDEELEQYFTKVPKVTELTPIQKTQIPTMVYETHLYSTDEMQRWVKINGKTLQEQQWVNGDIQVVEIQKQFLILEMGHIRFSLPALTDWQAIDE